MRHLDSFLKPMSAEMEYVERAQLGFPLQQLSDCGGNVRQVGPRVANIRPARIRDGADRFARLDQALCKPAVTTARSEKVARPHDERGHAVAAGCLEPLFHLDAYLAFPRQRV